VIRRTTVLLLEILLAIVVAAVLAVGAIAWRLSDGPIEIDWARAHLAHALSDLDTGFSTQIGRTTLAVSHWDRAFDVVAEDVVVLDGEGAVRSRIGAISVALSPEALLSGRLAPKRIDVLNPVVTVVRDSDGHWTMTPNDPSTGEDQDPVDLGEMLRAMVDGEAAGGQLGFLRSAQVHGATVRLVDDARGRTQLLTDVAGGIDLVATGLTFRMSGRAEWPDMAPTPISLQGDYRTDGEHLHSVIRFDGLEPQALAGLDPRLARLEEFDLPLTGTVEIDTNLDGSGLAGNARVSFGAGRVRIPEVNPDWLTVTAGSVAVDIAPTAEWMTLEGSLDLDGVLLAVNTRMSRERAGYAVIVDAVASDLPVDAIERFWPPAVSDGAREWVTENLRKGIVTGATLRAEGWVDANDPAVHDLDTLTGKIDFEGVETHYFRPLPPVVDTRGSAVFDATSMDIAVASGRLGSMTVEPSTIALVNLDRDTGERADVEVVVRGPIREALALIDREPLGYPSRIGLDAAATDGEFGTRLRFEIPLLRTLQVEDVGIAAAANLRGAVVPDVLRGQALTDGDLTLDLTAAGMTLAGEARIGGVPASLEHEERFVDSGPFRSRTRLRAAPEIAQLTAFGLDLNDVAAGPVIVEAEVVSDLAGGLVATIDGDLQAVSMQVTDLGWSKPADSVGIVRLDLARIPDGAISIPGFEFRAGTLFATGAVDFPEAGGAITSLSQFRLGRTQAAGRAEIEPGGAIRIAMEGPVIDLVPLLENETESDGSHPLEARFVADTLHLVEGITLEEGTLGVRQTGRRLETLALVGRLSGHPMRLVVQPADDRRLLTVASNDAGGFLKAFGIAESIEGGRLRVDGELIGDGLDDAMSLAIRIDEFRIVDAPVFARLLSVASFTGLFDALSGEGIRFARATANIDLGRDAIRIDEGVAYGPGLGLKVDGTVGRTDDSIDVEGLIAPAYSLSRLIDVVPVLGELLTGGEGEGLLATSYAVRGTTEDPRITVNPLTALAPGFVRDILAAASRPGDGPADWTPLPTPGLDETQGR